MDSIFKAIAREYAPVDPIITIDVPLPEVKQLIKARFKTFADHAEFTTFCDRSQKWARAMAHPDVSKKMTPKMAKYLPLKEETAVRLYWIKELFAGWDVLQDGVETPIESRTKISEAELFELASQAPLLIEIIYTQVRNRQTRNTARVYEQTEVNADDFFDETQNGQSEEIS